MGNIFSGSKVKTPAIQPPSATPVISSNAEDWALRMARRSKGFESTILAGDLVSAKTFKKTELG